MAMESSAILIRMPRALSEQSGDPVSAGARGGFTYSLIYVLPFLIRFVKGYRGFSSSLFQYPRPQSLYR